MKATFDIPAIIDIADQDLASEKYQAVELLEFDIDSMANAVLVDEFVLDGDFKAIDINVLAAGAPITAELEKPDATTWIVRLPRPFRLQKINVQQHQVNNYTMAEELISSGYFDYKLPEYQFSVGAAAVTDDRLSRLQQQAISDFGRGEYWTIAAGQLDIFPVIGDKIMSESIASVANNSNIDDLILEAFAIRARDSISYSRKELLVAQHGISVFIHSQPQGLSLGIAPVTNNVPDLEQVTELSGFNLSSNQNIVSMRDKADIWSSGIQNFLDKNFGASSDGEKYQLAVVFRSENPCRFESETSNNAYRLLFRDLAIFPNIDPENPVSQQEYKKNFGGTHWQSFYYQLSLPADSLLRSAVLPFKQSLKKKTYSFEGPPPSDQSLDTARAVELSTEQWTGGIFQLASAQSVSYMLIPMMALQPNTVCALEIREDIDGRPSGSIITQQSLQPGEVGKREWVSVALDDALPLYSKKLWWLVKTTQGKAIQFGVENPQGSGISHFSVSDSGGPGAIFRYTREFSVNPFFASDKSNGGDKLHAFIADGNNWLALESSEMPARNLNQFDLLLQLPDQTQASVASFTLRLSSLLKGNVKLYPPEIIYEILE